MSELSRDARALIEEVCSQDAPREADRERVRGKLLAALGAQAFVGAAGGTAHVAASSLQGGATGSSSVAKLAKASWWSKGAVAVSAAGVTAALYFVAAPPASRERPATTARPSPTAERAPVEVTPEPSVTPMAAVEQRSDEAEEPRSDASGEAPRRESTARSAKASRSAHKRAGEAAPSSAPAEPTPRAATEAQAQSTLGAELALLARAERALRDGKPHEALKLSTEYTERFGAGSLGEERDGVEALARCMLGQADKERALAFLERAPSSPLAPRVRRECGLE